MINCTNVAALQAELYYRCDDYYTKESPPAEWQGKGAEMLGLDEANAAKDFGDLLRGKLPNGDQIAGGPSSKHRAGLDLTISAPKSVSIAALVNQDDRIIAAHNEAVREALAHVEKLIQARVTSNNVTTLQNTSNLIARTVLHDTSRTGDSNLHTHCVIVNATQRADGSWVAMENREIYKAQQELDLVYKSELAVRVAQLGYQLRASKNGFELADVSDSQIAEYSKRKEDIDQALKKRGTSREEASGAEREVAALSTRDRKVEYDREALVNDWQARGRTVGLNTNIPAGQLDVAQPSRQAANDAMTFAQEHLGERESAWTEQTLKKTALGAAWGSATYKQIQTAAQVAELVGRTIRKEDGTLTTEKAQKLESKMLNSEMAGRGAVSPLTADAERLAADLNKTNLNDGQRGAVQTLMTTTNRVCGIQGLAGVGKTTLLNEFRLHAEAAGFTLEGVAPSHSAVKALGDAGIEGKTLQSWEVSGSKLDGKTILVLDESSLASTAQMNNVLKRASIAGARVVLVGDIGQYLSVDAGRAFSQLQTAGMQTAVVDKMLRQQVEELKEVAKLSAEGRGAEALEMLGDGIREIVDRKARHAAIASHFANILAEDRKDTLILTGSNADRKALNIAVRKEIGLESKGEAVKVFERGDLTSAEMRRAVSYQEGQALRFEKDYRSLAAAKGETWTVKQVVANEVVISHPDGREARFAPAQLSGKGFTVGTLSERELAPSDRIRITGSISSVDQKETLRNGLRATVLAITPVRITVRVDGSKTTVDLDARRGLSLDHGYAVTGHSAQGLGAKTVLLERDSKSRSASQRQFYTDVTRAKHELVVFTDDRKKLAEAVTRQTDKTQALDSAMPPPVPQLDLEKLEHKVQEAVAQKVAELVEKMVPPILPTVSRGIEHTL